MYDSKIFSVGSADADFEARLLSIHNLLTSLSYPVAAIANHAAAQESWDATRRSLLHRYEAAGTLARKRVDAFLNEASIEGGAGLQMLSVRADAMRAGAIAAARFLHARLLRALQRIDRLLPA